MKCSETADPRQACTFLRLALRVRGGRLVVGGRAPDESLAVTTDLFDGLEPRPVLAGRE